MATARALLRRFGAPVLRLGSFAITLLIWSWVARARFGAPFSGVIIVAGIVLWVPVSALARWWLDRDPTPARLHAATFQLHWLVMILVGAAIVEATKTGRNWRGWTLPLAPSIGWTLMWISGVACVLTVLNLAARGLGAPFAVALSRRLATDWLYRWTRNPMVLAADAFLVAFGLWIQSALFLAWVLGLVTPAFLLYLKLYEERELELRFGESYRSYKARTPMLIPGALSPRLRGRASLRAARHSQGG